MKKLSKKLKNLLFTGLACGTLFNGNMGAIKSENSFQDSCYSNVILNSDKDRNRGTNTDKNKDKDVFDENKDNKEEEISKRGRLTCALACLATGSASTMWTSNNPAKKTILLEALLGAAYFSSSSSILKDCRDKKNIFNKLDQHLKVGSFFGTIAAIATCWNAGEILLGKTQDEHGKQIKNWF